MPAFKEEFFGITMVRCHSIKSTMHRAFDTWAQNHPKISFTEVTDLCEQAGMLNENCPHAEVWVTYRNATRTGGSATVQAAVAIPKFVPTADFTFTNGYQPKITLQSGTQVPKQVLEVQGGRIELAYENPMCWYLDSDFCSVFRISPVRR